MLLFVYLALASSGGTIPLQALPGVLKFTANYEPLRQILDGTRGFVLTGLGLVLWLILGIAITTWYDRKGLYRMQPGTAGPCESFGRCVHARSQRPTSRWRRGRGRVPAVVTSRHVRIPITILTSSAQGGLRIRHWRARSTISGLGDFGSRQRKSGQPGWKLPGPGRPAPTTFNAVNRDNHPVGRTDHCSVSKGTVFYLTSQARCLSMEVRFWRSRARRPGR
jgi:hypothetical protein